MKLKMSIYYNTKAFLKLIIISIFICSCSLRSRCPEYVPGPKYLKVKVQKAYNDMALIYIFRPNDCLNSSDKGSEITINNKKVATLFYRNFTVIKLPSGIYDFNSKTNFTLRNEPENWKIGFKEYNKSKNLDVTIEQDNKFRFINGNSYYIRLVLTNRSFSNENRIENLGSEEEIKKSGENKIVRLFSWLRLSTFVEPDAYKAPYELSKENVPVSLFDYKAWNEEVKKSNYFDE